MVVVPWLSDAPERGRLAPVGGVRCDPCVTAEAVRITPVSGTPGSSGLRVITPVSGTPGSSGRRTPRT